eukprot:TRINITY_DN68976_c0_g1_i1.p1 TRINITY_DN68976_c0_g1~~TRINITY_DN68976_c0_g1_i1.p1  ORF type:complete len:221 (-),score=27.18 TRINITY_DN68976_c0_g1_i1:22-684(-)
MGGLKQVLSQAGLLLDNTSASATSFSAYDRQITEKVYFDVNAGGAKLGRITLGLYGKELPKTVNNFLHLAACDHKDPEVGSLCYKGSPFHRVIPGFMLQGGDFTHHDGTGGASIYGRTFPDEVGLQSGRKFPIPHDKPFLLSMANSGPDTNGSQFFITTVNTPHLDGHHTVFGEVMDGQDIVQKIESMGSGSGQTDQDISIEDAGVLPVEGVLDTGAKFL